MAPPFTVPAVTLSPAYVPLNFSPSCFSSMCSSSVVPNRSAEMIQFPLRSFACPVCCPHPTFDRAQAHTVKTTKGLNRIGKSPFSGMAEVGGANCSRDRLVAPCLDHAWHAANRARSVSILEKLCYQAGDFGLGSQASGNHSWPDALHRNGSHQLYLAHHACRLNQTHLHIFKTRVRQQGGHARSNVRVRAFSPHDLGVEFHIARQRRALRVRKMASEINVFHDHYA